MLFSNSLYAPSHGPHLDGDTKACRCFGASKRSGYAEHLDRDSGTVFYPHAGSVGILRGDAHNLTRIACCLGCLYLSHVSVNAVRQALMGLEPSRDRTIQWLPRYPTGSLQPYEYNSLEKLSLRTQGLLAVPRTLQTIPDLIIHLISSAAAWKSSVYLR